MVGDTTSLLDMAGVLFAYPESPCHAVTPNLTVQALDPPTRQDWERFKPTIIGKYLGLNTPLHEIVRDMEQCYGFRASQRMYKQRFTDWGAFKYKRAAEKRVARGGPSHDGSTYDNAGIVTMSRVPSSTTTTPLPMNDEDLQARLFPRKSTCNQSAECAHRRCIQAFLRQLEQQYIILSGTDQPYPPSSLPHGGLQCIGSVDQVLSHVRLFSRSWMVPGSHLHQDHITDAAAKAAQITSGLVGHCSHRSSPKQCERCTWAEFDFGLAMLEDGHKDLALASFELGCRLVHLLLSSPSKLFIRNLVMAFGSARWKPFEAFRRTLLDYMASMASLVLGNGHPITIILLHVACGDTLAASAELALRIMLDLFRRTYHAAHPDVLLIKRSLSVILRRQRNYHGSEQILLSAIEDSKRHNGYGCKETRRCLRRLGHLYMEQGRFSEAEAVFRKILGTAPGRSVYQENWKPDEISVYTYQHLARMANDMGDHNMCRYWFMKELDAAIKRWGIGGEYTAECLQVAYNEIPLEALGSAVQKYPDIFNQAEVRRFKGGIVISKARWCAVRNLI